MPWCAPHWPRRRNLRYQIIKAADADTALTQLEGGAAAVRQALTGDQAAVLPGVGND
jgi:hypothetical protein